MSNNTSLAKALANAQGQMSAADKNAMGNYGKYATLAAIWDACREALTQNGLSVTQAFEMAEDRTVVLRTTLMHESGEAITSIYPILPTKTDPQGYGSAITYARKYTLAAIVGIAADDDDDGAGTGRSKGKEQGTATRPQAPQTQQAQRPQAQTNGSGSNARPAGALEDDEQAIFDAQPKDFFDLVARFIPRYRNEPGKAMGAVEKITGKRSIPAKPMERVELFRQLKEHAKWRDAQDAPADLLEAAGQNVASIHANLGGGAYA